MGTLGRVLMASGLALGEIRQQDQDRSSPDASRGSFQHMPTPSPGPRYITSLRLLALRSPYSHYSSWQHVGKLGGKRETLASLPAPDGPPLGPGISAVLPYKARARESDRPGSKPYL